MKHSQLLSLSIIAVTATIVWSSIAEAAPVGFSARHFTGSARGGSGPEVSPCCNPGTGTIETRTTGFSTTTTPSGTVALPAGRPYFQENNWRTQYRIGDVDTADGGLNFDVAVGNSLATNPPLPTAGWLYYTRLRSTFYQTLDVGPGQGPGTYTYMATENPYTRMNVNQNTNMTVGGTTTTTTTSTINYPLGGKVSATAGSGQFGGTWNLMGTNRSLLAIVGQGTVLEYSVPVPFGPGATVPNGPAGIPIRREVVDSLIRVHIGTLSGPVVASIMGPGVMDIMPWTTGTVMLDNTSVVTPITAPFTYAIRTDVGNDTRTTASYLNGNLQLVSGALFASFTTNDPSDPTYTVFTRKANMDFVPEPGSLSLIGAGALALFAFSRVSQRKQ